MDDAKINELLDMLPNGYDNEFFKYMTITTILKAHDNLMFGTTGARTTTQDITTRKTLNCGIGAAPSTP